MADYSVDIAVAVKGSRQLKELRKGISQTSKELTTLNNLANKQSKTLPNSFLTLNKVLKQAKTNFDKAAIGTKGYLTSAKQLIEVEKQYNRQLVQRKMLLKDLRGTSLIDQVRANTAASQASRESSGFRAFSRKFQPPVIDKAQVAIDKSIARHMKKIERHTGKTAQILQQQQTAAGFQSMTPVPGGPNMFNKMGFGKNAQPTGMFAMPGGRSARLKGAVGSGMIGGGFPLLFGGSMLQAGAGLAAGAVGGALAPGGGFAASILATAAVAKFEEVTKFRKEVRNLNLEMADMGINSDISRKRIKELKKEFDITHDEALKLASQFKSLGGEMEKGITTLFGEKGFGIFNTLSGLRDTESVLEKISELSSEISEENRRQLLQTIATKGSLEGQLQLQKMIIDKRKNEYVREQMGKRYKSEFVSPLGPQADSAMAARGLLKKDAEARLAFEKELSKEFIKQNQATINNLENAIRVNEQLKFLMEFQAPSDEMRELLTPMRQIIDASKAIRTGFEESFKGIIKGTMSVQDAFRNMLNRIADHFFDTAARIAAVQMQKGFLSLFSNMFNFNLPVNETSDLNLDALDFYSSTGSNVTMSDFTNRANGGPVRGGKPYIVGERGPELFSPGVSGTITPNHALGGSMNVVVNVDASGSSVEGDESSGEELGRLIGAAVQAELIKEKRPGGLLG